MPDYFYPKTHDNRHGTQLIDCDLKQIALFHAKKKVTCTDKRQKGYEEVINHRTGFPGISK